MKCSWGFARNGVGGQWAARVSFRGATVSLGQPSKSFIGVKKRRPVVTDPTVGMPDGGIDLSSR
jgi:hypothetical protein